jgi:hypothetical protein
MGASLLAVSLSIQAAEITIDDMYLYEQDDTYDVESSFSFSRDVNTNVTIDDFYQYDSFYEFPYYAPKQSSNNATGAPDL